MIPLPPRSTRTDTLVPYTTLVLSHAEPGLDPDRDLQPRERRHHARDPARQPLAERRQVPPGRRLRDRDLRQVAPRRRAAPQANRLRRLVRASGPGRLFIPRLRRPRRAALTTTPQIGTASGGDEVCRLWSK